jgi:hypothetical protein
MSSDGTTDDTEDPGHVSFIVMRAEDTLGYEIEPAPPGVAGRGTGRSYRRRKSR